MESETWVSVKQLEQRGFGNRTTIWRQVKRGSFPAPVKISPGMTRWRMSDILKFESDLIAQAA